MIQQPQTIRQCQPPSPLSSTRGMVYLSILCLLGAVLQSGCVSSEKLKAEKVRALNFQRLLAQEEKRATTLEARLAQQDKAIKELNTQLQNTKDTITALESENRTLAAELDTLKEHNRHPPEPNAIQDSPVFSQDPGSSKDGPLPEPSLSDPFMSEEDLRHLLDRAESK